MSLPVPAPPEPEPAPPAERLRAAVAAHYEFVWRMLRRLGVPEAGVEDGAQQVLIVLANRMHDVRVGAERAFMIATATRVAADVRKKRARAREDLDPETLAALHSSAPLADELLDRGRARLLLDVVLDEMPDELRTVFVLFEFENLTMAAIAELLAVPPGTVASRLRRARATFELAAANFSQLRSRP